MVLSDRMAYRQVVGSLMYNPLLFLEYTDILPTDFDNKVARVCFIAIHNLYSEGATKLTIIEVEEEILKNDGASAAIYRNDGGLEFLKIAYEFAEPSNFELYYNRLKKYSLLRRLKKENYDISDYYKEDKDLTEPIEEIYLQERFDNATIEDILNNIEGKYNIIRSDYLHGGKKRGDPAEGIFELIEEFQKKPNIGPSLEGQFFSSACRGAREGCFYLKSASSGSGKSRTAVFDACRIAYPIRYSAEKGNFIKEIDAEGNERLPRKTLFIVTEMDKEELQSIILAYLSGVNESHILTGKYDFGELSRVKFAAKVMKMYSGYLLHTTASMLGQFQKNNLNEATILMMMANQLKQLAKDYGIFIFSATQVNMSAMADDGEFKNEMSIRGSKAVADKADFAYVMTKIGAKTWNSIVGSLKQGARQGIIESRYVEDEQYRPTHILDIYKNRRGSYKNVRIWTKLDLGTGYRKDLFMTTADNEPLSEPIDLFMSAREEVINYRDYLDGE